MIPGRYDVALSFLLLIQAFFKKPFLICKQTEKSLKGIRIMKLTIKRIVAAVVFLSILFQLINVVGFLARPLDADSDNVSYLYKEDKDSLNVVFMGSSAIYRFWIPQQAYEEQNFTSLLLATAGQNLDTVPYLMEEVKKTQNVDLFVVEIRSPLATEAHRIDGKDNEDVFLARLSYTVMGMKQSFNRLKLIRNVLEENKENTKLEWMFPILKYHENISSMTGDQMIDRLNGVDKEAIYTNITYRVSKQKAPNFEDDASIVLPEEDKRSIDRVEEKAKELGVKVLLVATPYIPNHTRAALHVQMNQYIDEQGYEYLNMTEKLDEIGLELTEDFYDKNHTNISGAQKVTEYLADYIAQNYELKDCLNEKQKLRWASACEEWNHEKSDLLKQWEQAVKDMNKD